jgi:hypothetical protein
MAEHDRGFDGERWRAYRAACSAASEHGAVLVPGIEYSDAANAVHVPVWGDLPFLGEAQPTASLLAAVQLLGGAAILAHPSRRDVLSSLSPHLLDQLVGMELWNRKYDGYCPSSTAAATLALRRDLLPVVGLDFHTAKQFHPLVMLLELDAPATPAAVAKALRAGRARATAFGLPAEPMGRSPMLHALGAVERCRRRAAQNVRRTRANFRRLSTLFDGSPR